MNNKEISNENGKELHLFIRILKDLNESENNSSSTKNPDSNLNFELKNLMEFGKFSFELEEKREQSIITQSNHMLTALSLFSAVIGVMVPILINYLIIPSYQILTATGLAMLPLFVSLVFVILAQWRYKYSTMQSGITLYENYRKNNKKYSEQWEFDYQRLAQIGNVQESKRNLNNKRANLLRVSMILFLISAGIMLQEAVFFILIYL